MSAETVSHLIEAAAAQLREAGVAKPRREANRLWAWQNRSNPGDSYLDRHRTAVAGRATQFRVAVERRIRGEPLAYVLGHTGFRRLDLRCDARALIPRPESEDVVELALARCRTGRALDMGTGTGCLALALADEGEFAATVAVDCSAPALELAAENAGATGLAIRLVRSDLGAGLGDERFDLLVSNPPYLTEAEFAALDPSVRDWEPAIALVAGQDGMAVAGRILREADRLLTPRGWLIMEVDSSRGGAAAAIATEVGWQEVAVHKDLFGLDRYLTARRGRSGGGGR